MESQKSSISSLALDTEQILSCAVSRSAPAGSSTAASQPTASVGSAAKACPSGALGCSSRQHATSNPSIRMRTSLGGAALVRSATQPRTDKTRFPAHEQCSMKPSARRRTSSVEKMSSLLGREDTPARTT